MLDRSPKNNWYQDFNLEEKSKWYGQIADAYNRTRPRYPEKLVRRAVEIAQLSTDAKILEIGSATGTATTTFAELGFSLVCVEPNAEFCQILARNCAPYEKVKIINTTFEEWELEKSQFDAVLAATSFHWISSEVACIKTAEALKTEGYLILLWNVPPQPTQEIYQKLLEPIYQTYAPDIKGYEAIATHQKNISSLGNKVTDSGKFQNLVSEELICEVTYKVDDYIELLSTLSPYIAMDSEQRQTLFANLRTSLHNYHGDSIDVSFLSVLQVAQKV
ncbi:MAG: methyltransferase domain-containing protein [Okeania sp. SIO3I5]|uniref:class I SAM-dependent methyltransferase n=1 Tax=Okeania sp. SIO3I5 TaxID=2607805 RepID=UPI0013B5B2B4|nr:methyltransferase domain-containing protein [Okeania sp. SIO3I5]NEQ41706.1 methyltransferase domain-containing protein [Okeania sp. SIO3I5]